MESETHALKKARESPLSRNWGPRKTPHASKTDASAEMLQVAAMEGGSRVSFMVRV